MILARAEGRPRAAAHGSTARFANRSAFPSIPARFRDAGDALRLHPLRMAGEQIGNGRKRSGCRRCGFWIFTQPSLRARVDGGRTDRLPLSGPALRDARCAGSSGLIGGSAPPPPPLTFARSQAARWLGVGCRRAGGGSARARSGRSQVEGCGRHGPGRGGRVGLRRTEVAAPESGERSEPARLAEPPDRRRPTPPHPARPSCDPAPRVGLTLAAAILPGALVRLRAGYCFRASLGARDPPFETPAARAPQGCRW